MKRHMKTGNYANMKKNYYLKSIIFNLTSAVFVQAVLMFSFLLTGYLDTLSTKGLKIKKNVSVLQL